MFNKVRRSGALLAGFILAAMLGASALLPAPAQAQGYHYIVGLNPRGDNFLALRSEPDGNGHRIAKLGPDTLLFPTGARAGRWLQVEVVNTAHAGLYGWVFDRYVACCSGSLQPAAVTYGRVAHPGGAALNMRAGPSLGAAVVGAIPNGVSGIPVGECIYESAARSWCSVSYNGRNGWVSTRYFVRY